MRTSGVRWRELALLVRATTWLVACAPQGSPRQPIGLTHELAPVRQLAPARAPRAASGETAPAPPARVQAPEVVSAGPPAVPRRLCSVPNTPVEAPLFATNDAGLRPRGTQILDDVVACYRAGLYRGQRLVLTGHADRRGSAAYNRELALRRARSVQRYLVRHGVPAADIDVCSSGESEGGGTGPESWTYDRRVEIALQPARAAGESGKGAATRRGACGDGRTRVEQSAGASAPLLLGARQHQVALGLRGARTPPQPGAPAVTTSRQDVVERRNQ